MEKIPVPSKLDIKASKENANRALVTIEPCYPGYGATLGNALRRVLMSSLKGAAVVAVKIKGAHHEFSTLPGIKEDVVDILLNLKQLRVAMTIDEPAILYIKVSGEKKVTGKDIQSVTGVKIINPELEIATLTDKKAEFEAKLWVKPGRGYVLVDEQEKIDLEVDAIKVDSTFTPVLNVALKVENVRVGDKTNYDKLILDITTNGAISPEDAVKDAGNILIEQLNFVVNPVAQTEEIVELGEEINETEKDIEEEKLTTKSKASKENKDTKKKSVKK